MRDAELDDLRGQVDCRVVLEKAGWLLDAMESTAHAAKYRDGPARIVIVTHQGKGWFDPLNNAHGDVIALAQHLWGGTLGHARKTLRPLAGLPPGPKTCHDSQPAPTRVDALTAWDRAHRLRPGSPGWSYLTGKRALPVSTLDRALSANLLREGIHGTIWALHRDGAGVPCGWEMRGPQYKGFAKGCEKALFWIGDLAGARRVAVAESAIDALSLATLEVWPEGTAYVSTGGGFGPHAGEVLRVLLPATARLVAATDRGGGGELLADRLRELAATACAGFGRLRPIAKDWNDQLSGV